MCVQQTCHAKYLAKSLEQFSRSKFILDIFVSLVEILSWKMFNIGSEDIYLAQSDDDAKIIVVQVVRNKKHDLEDVIMLSCTFFSYAHG